MAKNKSNVKFARVPTGNETCGFCIMLASRGFVYSSEDAASGLNHYHSGCDCRVVPSWDKSSVDGYDPDAYYEQYKEAYDALKADGAHFTSDFDELKKVAEKIEELATSRNKPAANTSIDASEIIDTRRDGRVTDSFSELANGSEITVHVSNCVNKNGLYSIDDGKTFDSENFFVDTAANFKRAAVPAREPDYVSGSGSAYWYSAEGVIRVSDHWGAGVASCNWSLEDRNEFVNVWGGKYNFQAGHSLSEDSLSGDAAGFCEWKNFASNNNILPDTIRNSSSKIYSQIEQQTGYRYENYAWYDGENQLSSKKSDKMEDLFKSIADKSITKVNYIID